jgi:hypothetical protein
MRSARLAIPARPDAFTAPGYSPAALAQRERFLRGMAAAYAAAGDTRTASLTERDADVQRARHQPSQGN